MCSTFFSDSLHKGLSKDTGAPWGTGCLERDGTQDFLKNQIGGVLSKCLAELCTLRPPDPIEFIARWLYRYADNRVYLEDKSAFKVRTREGSMMLEYERRARMARMKASLDRAAQVQGLSPKATSLDHSSTFDYKSFQDMLKDFDASSLVCILPPKRRTALNLIDLGALNLGEDEYNNYLSHMRNLNMFSGIYHSGRYRPSFGYLSSRSSDSEYEDEDGQRWRRSSSNVGSSHDKHRRSEGSSKSGYSQYRFRWSTDEDSERRRRMSIDEHSERWHRGSLDEYSERRRRTIAEDSERRRRMSIDADSERRRRMSIDDDSERRRRNYKNEDGASGKYGRGSSSDFSGSELHDILNLYRNRTRPGSPSLTQNLSEEEIIQEGSTPGTFITIRNEPKLGKVIWKFDPEFKRIVCLHSMLGVLAANPPTKPRRGVGTWRSNGKECMSLYEPEVYSCLPDSMLFPSDLLEERTGTPVLGEESDEDEPEYLRANFPKMRRSGSKIKIKKSRSNANKDRGSTTNVERNTAKKRKSSSKVDNSISKTKRQSSDVRMNRRSKYIGSISPIVEQGSGVKGKLQKPPIDKQYDKSPVDKETGKVGEDLNGSIDKHEKRRTEPTRNVLGETKSSSQSGTSRDTKLGSTSDAPVHPATTWTSPSRVSSFIQSPGAGRQSPGAGRSPNRSTSPSDSNKGVTDAVCRDGSSTIDLTSESNRIVTENHDATLNTRTDGPHTASFSATKTLNEKSSINVDCVTTINSGHAVSVIVNTIHENTTGEATHSSLSDHAIISDMSGSREASSAKNFSDDTIISNKSNVASAENSAIDNSSVSDKISSTAATESSRKDTNTSSPRNNNNNNNSNGNSRRVSFGPIQLQNRYVGDKHWGRYAEEEEEDVENSFKETIGKCSPFLPDSNSD